MIERNEILNLQREESNSMNDLLSIPYLFVVADPGGPLSYCATNLLKGYFQIDIVTHGTSFAIKNAGVNAISLSMEYQSVRNRRLIQQQRYLSSCCV